MTFPYFAQSYFYVSGLSVLKLHLSHSTFCNLLSQNDWNIFKSCLPHPKYMDLHPCIYFYLTIVLNLKCESELLTKLPSFFLFLFTAVPTAYGSSQANGRIGAVAAGLRHSHSNTRSEPCLQLAAADCGNTVS